MSRLLFFLLIFGTAAALPAQKFTLSGYLKDASNGEDLIGATVMVKETGPGVLTNQYGFYSLSLPEGSYTIVMSYLGFEKRELEVQLNANVRKDMELELSSTLLEEVQITAQGEDQNVNDAQIGVSKLDLKEIESIPVLFGERDVMKTIQMLPGVKGAGDGNTGFYVRGGGQDQNLILLDEAPVYNSGHMLGFFSVFNSDALKDVSLYKGGIPAEYGGRASSVLDIRMKEGNSKKLAVKGGIGLIASRLTVEAPIVKDKGSFMLSGRRTYADLFLKLSGNETMSDTRLYFYDFNLKSNYKFGEKDRIFLSAYLGRDVFGFGDEFGLDYGNKTATLRWNHLYSNKLFSNTSLIASDYSYEFGFGGGDEAIKLKSFIHDWNLKQDFTLFANSNNTLKFGANVIYHNFQTGKLVAGSNSGIADADAANRYALEGAGYIQNEQTLSPRLSLNYGLRYSFFNQIGPDTAYSYNADGEIISETGYSTGESVQYYGGLEPRLSARYKLDELSSVKLGLDRNIQYLHLLSNSTTSSPTDLWVPSSNNIKPQIAYQLSVGYFRNFQDNMYEFSAEAYYKDLQNLIDYKNGADLFRNNSIESVLVYGEGQAYGLEFFLKKRKGRLTGWLSYTLSRTERNFDAIDGGATFPARQDRTHDLSITAMYKLSKKMSLSANWVYNTGDAASFPSGRYEINGVIVPYYTERNGYRMPDYHRLDLGVTVLGKQTEKFKASWNFSLYNAYGRENAYSISFQPSEVDPAQTEAIQLSLFRWVPSVSYNFNF